MILAATKPQAGLIQIRSDAAPVTTSRGGSLQASLASRSAGSQRSSLPSFSATMVKAQSTTASQPTAVPSAAPKKAAPTLHSTSSASTALSRDAKITTSSAEGLEGQGLIFTPLGVFDPLNRFASIFGHAVKPMVALEDGQGKLTKSYFLNASPGEYLKDEQKIARFSELFGPKATRTLRAFGAVEGHTDPSFQASAEQLSVYDDQGHRAWYSVMDLMDTLPGDRAALGLDLSAYAQADLLALYRTDPNYRFYTSGSAPVNATTATLGRA